MPPSRKASPPASRALPWLGEVQHYPVHVALFNALVDIGDANAEILRARMKGSHVAQACLRQVLADFVAGDLALGPDGPQQREGQRSGTNARLDNGRPREDVSV